MKILTFALVLVAASCTPFAANSADSHTGSLPELTNAQKAAIGKKIWQNECGGTVDGLTTWNEGEEFPSLGIGHFIWYTSSHQGPFTETWPLFMQYCKDRGVRPPSIALSADSPWHSQTEFKKNFQSGPMIQLRQWLASSVTLQTDFIINRSRATLPKILNGAPADDRARIAAHYQKVASTAQGQYALIDYVNFKGEGLNPSERYKGKGWGLLQVLGGMKHVPSGPAAATEFAASATRALHQRIDNSPPARGEARWRAGWTNRCQTYAHPL
jgi:hypothetical protein